MDARAIDLPPAASYASAEPINRMISVASRNAYGGRPKLDPFVAPDAEEEDPDLSPRAYGIYGIPYTTGRVQAGSFSENISNRLTSIVGEIPWRATGKL
jgi:hypothetical protein